MSCFENGVDPDQLDPDLISILLVDKRYIYNKWKLSSQLDKNCGGGGECST